MHYQKNNKKTIIFNQLTHLLLLNILAISSANAADWESIKKTKDYVLMVDMDSYNETDGKPLITAKTIYTRTQQLTSNGKKFAFIEMHATHQFNCKAQTYRMLNTHYYAQKQILVTSLTGKATDEPIAAHADVATTASLVCQVHQMLGGQ